MESNEEDTLIELLKNKIRCIRTTLIIEGCIKKSIEEHELEGISYLSRFRKM
jgi:hypothetical protein